MQYQEKKIDTGFEYYGAGVFGEMTLQSTVALDGEKLDGILNLLVNKKEKAQESTGEIKVDETTVINYKFKKTLPWGDEAVQPIEICEDTPTETQKRGRWYTAIKSCIVRTYNWCKRFVAAFREALKNSSNQ